MFHTNCQLLGAEFPSKSTENVPKIEIWSFEIIHNVFLAMYQHNVEGFQRFEIWNNASIEVEPRVTRTCCETSLLLLKRDKRHIEFTTFHFIAVPVPCSIKVTFHSWKHTDHRANIAAAAGRLTITPLQNYITRTTSSFHLLIPSVCRNRIISLHCSISFNTAFHSQRQSDASETN